MNQIIKKPISLDFVWSIRLKVRVEADKLSAEAKQLFDESQRLSQAALKLYAELPPYWIVERVISVNDYKRWTNATKVRGQSVKLRAKSDELDAEAMKLYMIADQIWTDAVFRVYGNIKMRWMNYNMKKGDYECHLETGEVFKP